MNRAQSNRLETTLWLLNLSIHEMDRLLALPAVDEPLFHWKSALSEDKKSRIRSRLADLREMLGDLVKKNGLVKREENLLARVTAQLHTHWVSIEDSKCKALSKYGEIPPGLKETLDPDLEDLNVEVRRLLDELTVKRPAP